VAASVHADTPNPGEPVRTEHPTPYTTPVDATRFASLALAARADLKVIADQFGHCRIVLTADTYISVTTELGLAAAEAVARLILRAGKRPPGGKMPRRADARPLAVIAA
jgi:hypothetical protein